MQGIKGQFKNLHERLNSYNEKIAEARNNVKVEEKPFY